MEVGTRVLTTDFYNQKDGLWEGIPGTVKAWDGTFASVEFDRKGKRFGHNCGGLTKPGCGWYISKRYLKEFKPPKPFTDKEMEDIFV